MASNTRGGGTFNYRLGIEAEETAVASLAMGCESPELNTYQKILSGGRRNDQDDQFTEAAEELKLVPVIWWDVKEHLTNIPSPHNALSQYAVLGHSLEESQDHPKPVLLNTNSPWSAFLCGSQGSGKSHALSCMLENCLLDNPAIGKNPNPLAALVFHYDRTQGSGVCEAAYLCTSIKTRVLVSPSNYATMQDLYDKMASSKGATIEVQELRLLPDRHLNTERIKTLMATGKEGEIPLYMHVFVRLLRDLAIKHQGKAVAGRKKRSFSYQELKNELEKQMFTDRQNAPLKMRLELMESFLDLKHRNPDYLVGEPGTLTIIDLTDPVVDSDGACALFDICLSIFMSQSECSKIVALDEAHNYMGEGSNNTVKDFTERLLKTIREQRHQATRVVIATQEPTINTRLLDLCSIIMVHRCTSPAWFAVLKGHIAGISVGEVDGENIDDRTLFDMIVRLRLGESLLFCPTAATDVAGDEVVRMNAGFKKFKTRQRVTADGGVTRTADRRG